MEPLRWDTEMCTKPAGTTNDERASFSWSAGGGWGTAFEYDADGDFDGK